MQAVTCASVKTPPRQRFQPLAARHPLTRNKAAWRRRHCTSATHTAHTPSPQRKTDACLTQAKPAYGVRCPRAFAGFPSAQPSGERRVRTTGNTARSNTTRTRDAPGKTAHRRGLRRRERANGPQAPGAVSGPRARAGCDKLQKLRGPATGAKLGKPASHSPRIRRAML